MKKNTGYAIVAILGLAGLAYVASRKQASALSVPPNISLDHHDSVLPPASSPAAADMTPQAKMTTTGYFMVTNNKTSWKVPYSYTGSPAGLTAYLSSLQAGLQSSGLTVMYSTGT